jgi:glycosyltransferase involved in cell wall biosynthesis
VLADEIARRSGLRADRIRVLPDAVDVSMFEGLPARDDARRMLGLPTDRPIVGYVGRFTAVGLEKGIPTIIEGAELVSDDRTMFLFVGGPMTPVASYVSRIRATGLSEDRFRFEDRVPNDRVPLWLAALDVALMPSPNLPHFAVATSPLKMFEYMAAGLPIVATDLPSLRDVLRHGENAWLATPDDAPAFARGVSALLSDHVLAERLGARARTDAASHTWDARARIALEGLEVPS